MKDRARLLTIHINVFGRAKAPKSLELTFTVTKRIAQSVKSRAYRSCPGGRSNSAVVGIQQAQLYLGGLLGLSGSWYNKKAKLTTRLSKAISKAVYKTSCIVDSETDGEADGELASKIDAETREVVNGGEEISMKLNRIHHFAYDLCGDSCTARRTTG